MASTTRMGVFTRTSGGDCKEQGISSRSGIAPKNPRQALLALTMMHWMEAVVSSQDKKIRNLDLGCPALNSKEQHLPPGGEEGTKYFHE